jgi:diguanylate cyclase (GGDEF)-like protein
MPLVAHTEHSERILVVDDNPTNVMLLSSALKKSGYGVLIAENGKKGIEIARQQSPDLILLDILMPGQSGFEVCNILKSDPLTSAIPIIFVTAATDTETIVNALSRGGCDYITKPFILNEVVARVSVHLRLRRTERELLKRNRELEIVSKQLQNVNEELARLTRLDPLTNLLNRRAWQESAQLERERANRFGDIFSICMIDVDYFKNLNDSRGHQTGDECLKQIAKSIQGTCRNIDVAGRYGGEEFVVLLPETDIQGAVEVADRIREDIYDLKLPHPDSPVAGYVTVSIGVASYEADSWENVVKRADDALYTAKRTGRNRIYFEPTDPLSITAAHQSRSPVLPHIARGDDPPLPPR